MKIQITLLVLCLCWQSTNTKKNTKVSRDLSDFQYSAEEIREQETANESYQRHLGEYLQKFRNEQEAIADRFEETYEGLLAEIESNNKKAFVDNVQDLAKTVLKIHSRHEQHYKNFDKLRTKLRNEWMFPKV